MSASGSSHVPSCPHCSHDNPASARFCMACGGLLAERKTAAQAGHCPLLRHRGLDGPRRADRSRSRPRVDGRVLQRDAHRDRGARGTVEKFIGDAVVGVFGVPIAHEDDALRGVRAAAEMRERLAALNEELERSLGARLSLRIGVNTGEVVASDPAARESFVSGDTVNVAARLEQAASADGVLLGETTHALVARSVEAEASRPCPSRERRFPSGRTGWCGFTARPSRRPAGRRGSWDANANWNCSCR